MVHTVTQKLNTTGSIIKPLYIRPHRETDKGKPTLMHTQKLRCIRPQTRMTLTMYGKLRGSVQRLSQLLLRSAAIPAHYTQSTTVNIYSPPEERLPAAKTNHFTAPAAWLIRHICLSFSQASSVGKASKASSILHVHSGPVPKKNTTVFFFFAISSYLKMWRKCVTLTVSLVFACFNATIKLLNYPFHDVPVCSLFEFWQMDSIACESSVVKAVFFSNLGYQSPPLSYTYINININYITLTKNKRCQDVHWWLTFDKIVKAPLIETMRFFFWPLEGILTPQQADKHSW